MIFNEGDPVWARVETAHEEHEYKGVIIGVSWLGKQPARYFVNISPRNNKQHIVEFKPDDLRKRRVMHHHEHNE